MTTQTPVHDAPLGVDEPRREADPLLRDVSAGGIRDRRWRDRRLAIGVVVAAAAAYGLLAGWWTPRGPNDATQALSAMALSLGVGLLSGAVLRSRWAMVLAPVTFAVVFELVRLDATGATVDKVSLSSEYE